MPPPPGSAVLDLGGGVLLSVTPESQYSGRDISFALSGLTPWKAVTVSFIDPQGSAASWITPDDVNLVDRVSGADATSYTLYPTSSGELDWIRYGIQDAAGTWSMELELDGGSAKITYGMSELQLGGQETVQVGVDLTKNSGPESTVYYSDLVPTALMLDLQTHLSETAALLEQRTGTAMSQLPDLYLMGNREIMEQVAAATGVSLGFEDGYFKSYGARPGIFMRTDVLSTQSRRLLTHEYVHQLFDGLAQDKQLPAWLTEGLAGYYEYDIASSGPRANAFFAPAISDDQRSARGSPTGQLVRSGGFGQPERLELPHR